MAASARANEEDSIAALRLLPVLDTAPEEQCDALVAVVSAVCGKPTSLIGLVDAGRQWFKANVGLPGVQQTAREAAFCAHAVLGADIFEVEDARRDERFADSPLVVGQPDIRFYAGAPLTLGSGERVGTLCVIGPSPGKLTELQREVLGRLAVVAVKALEGRVAAAQAERAMRVAAASHKDLRLVVDNAPAMMAYGNADLSCRFANQAYRHWLGLNPEARVGQHIRDVLGPALFVERNQPQLDAALAGGQQSFERLVPVAERMTGWSTGSARGPPLEPVFQLVNEQTRAVTENPVATCLAQGKIVGLANHTLLISRDGAEYGIEDSAAPIPNAAGQVLGVVLVVHDVSEQRRILGEMTYRATHDPLTGLVDRTEFETRLLRVLRKAHEEESAHALHLQKARNNRSDGDKTIRPLALAVPAGDVAAVPEPQTGAPLLLPGAGALTAAVSVTARLR